MYCDWPVLERCCFCLPLRKGVLTFGYISIILNALMVGVYSILDYRGMYLPGALCLALYLFETIFDAVLIYGAHKKLAKYLKYYIYFAVTTTFATAILQLIVGSQEYYSYPNKNAMVAELLSITFAEFCLHIYIITVVRSLFKKLEVSGPHESENQLQKVVTGENKANNTTEKPTNV